MPPVKKSSAAHVRDAIENDILIGQLRPGDRMPDEASLAERFGVSRTPVREALAQLDSSGLIELKPNRGAFVSEITPQKLIEMFEVMAELEGMAGRLAARRISAQDRDKLIAIQKDCRTAAEAGDCDAYYYENEKFHQAIYLAARNGFLLEQCLGVQRRLRPYRRLQLRARNRVRSSMAEHDEVVAAIIAGQQERAEAALKSHVMIQGERFTDLVALLAPPPELRAI